MNSLIAWLESHMLSCPSKTYLNLACPGCGFQRSTIALLKGNIAESLQLYPATIPLLFVVIFSLVHIKAKFSFGAALIKYLYIFTALIIVISYIYKITH
jgi:hypothetical protein